jgi:hypothetical protein
MKMKIVMEREINIQSVRSKMEKRKHAKKRQKHILKYKCTKVEQKRKRERKEERKIEGRIKNKAETIRKIRQVFEEHRNRNALRKKNQGKKRGKVDRIFIESAKEKENRNRR